MASTINFKDAELLAQDQYSSVKIETVKRKVNLSFKHIQCTKKGIQEILDNELNLYSESLQGAMIAYQKIRLYQNVGRIVECQPFLQFNVQVDVAVFRPYKGAKMKGIINKIGNDHIGLLLHNIFNCSLRRPIEIDTYFSIGQEVWFTVWKVYQHGGLTAIHGNLDLESVGVTGASVEDTSIQPHNAEKNVSTPSVSGVSSSGGSKSRKRKRTLSSAGDLEISTSVEVKKEDDHPGLLSPTSEKERKKRKKDKGIEDVVDGEKKKRKRKRSLSGSEWDTSNIADITEENLVMTPSEKKRKRRKKDKDDTVGANSSLLETSTISPTIDSPGETETSIIGSPPIVSLSKKLHVKSDVDFSSSSAKKKHKHKEATNTSTPMRPKELNETRRETAELNDSQIDDTPSSSKKHKKKKHKKNKDGELDSTLNESIISRGKSNTLTGSDSGISDSTPQSVSGSTKKKKKSKADTSIST